MGIVVSIPFLIKWLKIDQALRKNSPDQDTRVTSINSIGNNQKIVTLEVGPVGERTYLVIGATQQQISLLHSGPVSDSKPKDKPDVLAGVVDGKLGG